MKKNKPTYAEAIKEIETILLKIENEELDVDSISENVQRASELIKFCKEKLYLSEKEVEKVLNTSED